MMRIDTVVTLFSDLPADELIDWVRRSWVRPDSLEDGTTAETWVFTELDVARVRLVYDLRRDLEIAEEVMPVVLSLLDQIYELRCTLKSVDRAVAGQPENVRAAIAAAMLRKETEN